ncbi:hypothetical protein H9P43_003481 [Blastocladiella emersonii ATCC 22665]|nr:hypothetical protein H9P43_003481 [Blastocladiella emersonii ATCC 22665]
MHFGGQHLSMSGEPGTVQSFTWLAPQISSADDEPMDVELLGPSLAAEVRKALDKAFLKTREMVEFLSTTPHAESVVTAYGREALDAVIEIRCENFYPLIDAFGYRPADLPWFLQPAPDIAQLVRAARIEFPQELNGLVPIDMREDLPLRSRDSVRESVSDADLATLREAEPSAPSLSEFPLWTPTPANQAWIVHAQWAATHAPGSFGDILLHRDPYEPEPAASSSSPAGSPRVNGPGASSCIRAGTGVGGMEEFEVEAIVDSMVNTRVKDAYGRIKCKIYWRHHGLDWPWTPAPDVVPTAHEALAGFYRLNPSKPKSTPEQPNEWIEWLDEQECERKGEEA